MLGCIFGELTAIASEFISSTGKNTSISSLTKLHPYLIHPLFDVKVTVLDAFMTTYYFLKMYKGRRNVLFVNNTSTVNLLVVKMAASL